MRVIMGNRWKKQSMQERFEEKFIKSDSCWEWVACKHNRGYGMFHTGRDKKKGHMEFAHRVSYALFIGSVPDDLEVRHKCDNPSCVNPNHLELGSHADNMKDMMTRGRWVSGNSKLSKEEKLKLIGTGIQNIMTFGYSHSQASRINRGIG